MVAQGQQGELASHRDRRLAVYRSEHPPPLRRREVSSTDAQLCLSSFLADSPRMEKSGGHALGSLLRLAVRDKPFSVASGQLLELVCVLHGAPNSTQSQLIHGTSDGSSCS